MFQYPRWEAGEAAYACRRSVGGTHAVLRISLNSLCVSLFIVAVCVLLAPCAREREEDCLAGAVPPDPASSLTNSSLLTTLSYALQRCGLASMYCSLFMLFMSINSLGYGILYLCVHSSSLFCESLDNFIRV